MSWSCWKGPGGGDWHRLGPVEAALLLPLLGLLPCLQLLQTEDSTYWCARLQRHFANRVQHFTLPSAALLYNFTAVTAKTQQQMSSSRDVETSERSPLLYRRRQSTQALEVQNIDQAAAMLSLLWQRHVDCPSVP